MNGRPAHHPPLGRSHEGLTPVQPLAGALATPADPGADDIPF
jgi:hypothetical protein